MDMKLITCPETARIEAIDCQVEHDGDLSLVLRCTRFEPPEAVLCSMPCMDRMNRRRTAAASERRGAAGLGYADVTFTASRLPSGDASPPVLPGGQGGSSSPDDLRDRVIDALRSVIDPELGIDIVELGLVYAVDVDGGHVRVALTTTSPACPLADMVTSDAEVRARAIPGVESVEVRLVWEPPWGPERMSPTARRALGWEL
jgi:metal-sulfur cluster biosynthetic enzyme